MSPLISAVTTRTFLRFTISGSNAQRETHLVKPNEVPHIIYDAAPFQIPRTDVKIEDVAIAQFKQSYYPLFRDANQYSLTLWVGAGDFSPTELAEACTFAPHTVNKYRNFECKIQKTISVSAKSLNFPKLGWASTGFFSTNVVVFTNTNSARILSVPETLAYIQGIEDCTPKNKQKNPLKNVVLFRHGITPRCVFSFVHALTFPDPRIWTSSGSVAPGTLKKMLHFHPGMPNSDWIEHITHTINNTK